MRARAARLSARQVSTYQKQFAILPVFGPITAACLSCVRRGPGEYGTTSGWSRLICRPANCACKQLVTRSGIRVFRCDATWAAGYPHNETITSAGNFPRQNRTARFQWGRYGTVVHDGFERREYCRSPLRCRNDNCYRRGKNWALPLRLRTAHQKMKTAAIAAFTDQSYAVIFVARLQPVFGTRDRAYGLHSFALLMTAQQ